jgi:hypothetical protein
MRLLALLLAMPSIASAEVSGAAAIGAGAQGDATYGAVDVGLTATWPGVRIGVGARGVWDDGVFRRAEWSRPADAVAVIRDVELVYGPVALAAGRLAPSHLAHLADGYRATLDDRWRTGARTAVRTDDVDATAEIDDVLDPAVIGASVRWQLAKPYALHAAVTGDPDHRTAIEAGVARGYEGDRARLEVGGSVVAELGLGVSGVAFADAAIERSDVRWTARADVRAGTGSVGGLFGPLYRVERTHDDFDHGGVGAGLALGARADAGWFDVAIRERPGLGVLAALGGGAPMGRWVQAGLWAAASRTDAAGAVELRVAWAKRFYSALQLARFYRFDTMEPAPLWSVTAWFGASSE